MDPISVIMAALTTGAAAGLKPAAEEAVKDAYAGLRALIKRKYERVGLDSLERDPASASKQNVVKGDLERTSIAGDQEALSQAKVLLDAVHRHAPEVAQTVGVDLEDVRAAWLKIDGVFAEGTGVKVTKADIDGGVEIKGVRAGNVKDSPNP